MADKKSFFESITKETKFNNEFYKKVYGYSLYDQEFLAGVKEKFISLGRVQAIQEYDNWVRRWEHDYLYGYTDAKGKKHNGVISVSRWYATECKRQWDKLVEKYGKERGGENYWAQKELLMKKKELLLKKKLLLLN